MKFNWMRILASVVLFGAALPAGAQDIVPPKVNMTTPGFINAADGEFDYHETDLSIGPLTLDRFYQPPSQLALDNAFFGPGMTSNFDIYVAPNFAKATKPPNPYPQRYHPIVHIGASASGVYTQVYPQGSTSDIESLNIDADSGDLEWSSGAYVYTDAAGDVYTFTPLARAGGLAGPYSQRVDHIVFADGRTQTFSYDTNQHLHLVTDSSGYAIVFDYNASGYVSAACGFNLSQTYVSAATTCSGATLTVSYTYSGTLLDSMTDVFGQVTTYGGCIKPPGFTVCKYQNVPNGFGGISQQTIGGTQVWNIGSPPAYNGVNDPDAVPTDCANSAVITDPNGKTTSFTLTKSVPCTMTDSNGKMTSYKWLGGSLEEVYYPATNEGSLLTEVDYPEGNKYLAEYHGPFNSVSKQTIQPKPGSGLPNLVTQYVYNYTGTTPQNIAKPIAKIDPKGNEADFTYASWGGVLSEMQPAPSTGAARPLKLYTYVQMSAYVKNSGGTLVSTGVPIWVPSTVIQCQTVAGSSTAACDTAAGAPRLQTTYQYPTGAVANNLLSRGTEVKDLVTGATRLTCVSYDPIGRKISSTSPRGNTAITVCP